MKRTSKKKIKVDAILTADWHLREDTPTCWEGDFWAAQWNVVEQVSKLQKKYGCSIYHAGDLFHHWKPSPRLLTECIQRLPDHFCTVYGNHDLPQHSIELAFKAGITTLARGHHIQLLKRGHWNDEPEKANAIFPHERKAYIWHKFVYTGKPPFPGAEKEPEGHWLLDSYPQFDLIVTGDNHIPFVCKEDGRVLVNPGSLTRQTAKQINHKPRVYLYNSMKNIVKPHYLEVPEDVISRQHIEQKEERDERISAFVERLGTEWEGDLDFRENLKRFEQENDIDKEVMKITYKALEER